MSKPILIYNARLLDEAMDTPGAVLIVDGKIRSVFQGYFTTADTVQGFAKAVLKEDGYGEGTDFELADLQGLTLTPAFIDMHVHMRYPGQTQKEDLASGLRAAVAGGYGTVVAMPNTNPVVSSIDMAMKIEREAAALGLAHLFQVVSITKDFEGQSTEHIDILDKKYVPVISEDGHDVLSASVMLDGMKKAASKGLIVSCHCEDPTLALQARPLRQEALAHMKELKLTSWGEPSDDESNLSEDEVLTFAEPLSKANELLREAEDLATVRNLMLAQKAGCHIHLAHVSTARSIQAIREFKIEHPEMKITCEITPHHLAIENETALEWVNSTQHLRSLVNPPIRDGNDLDEIRAGILDGTVDVISTDHAPHTMDDKAAGSPGFTGLETAFGVCNTILVKKEYQKPRLLSALMSANPARILGLNKGLLQPGYDADLTVLDPDEEWVVDTSAFYSKGKASPFNGIQLTGRIKAVFIDGRRVFERD